MIRLRKLNNENPVTTVDYLADYDTILKKISHLANNTQRGYLITIIQALKSTNKYDDEKDVYEAKLEELEYIRQEAQDNYRKSDKEKERWCSLIELKAVADYWLEMIDEVVYNKYSAVKVFNIYKMALISLLYTEQPPIRLEYATMSVIESEELVKPGTNYMLREGDNYFVILQEFKTKKSQGNKRIPITSTKLKKILDEWLKLNTSGYLFPTPDYSTHITPNAFGKLVPKAFESIGKKITLNILRHIFISENVDYKILENNSKIASMMCHNTDTQKTYIKV
jgi:hypothetical protein